MRKVFYFILFLIIISCKKETSIEWIDISGSLNRSRIVPLSSVAAKIQYISLETDTICLINRIKDPQKDIVFQDNLIYIKDIDKLLCFDNKGNYIRNYGKRGKGPGEFTDIREFAVIPGENNIFIFSASSQNTLAFSHNGDFLYNFRIDFWPTLLTAFNSNLIFINCKGRRGLTDYFTMTITNQKGEQINRLLYRENEAVVEKKESLGLWAEDGTTYNYLDSLSYWEFNYDTIWRVSNDLEIMPRYYVNYGKDKLPFDFLLLSNRDRRGEAFQKHTMLTKILETPSYFFFELNNKGQLTRIFYDKLNKTASNLRFKTEESTRTYFAFINDIDNGMPFWPDGVISENKVFQIVYPHQIKEHIKLVKHTFKEPLTHQQQRFVDLSIDIDINDNPIIMIVELKK